MTQKNETNQQSLYEQKEVAFYGTSVGAWFNTRLEKSKQLLTLSSLAIGLLMFFYTDLESKAGFVIWILAGVCFVFCMLLSLWILDQNADYLKAVVKEDANQEALSSSIGWKAKGSSLLFIAGVLLTFSLAVMQSGFTIQKVAKGAEINELKK